jgi:putative transposon-encoded protein
MTESTQPPGKHEIEGYEVIYLTVKPGGCSARINMAKKHSGKRVAVVVLDP